MGGQKDKCMPSSLTEGYLTPDHVRFVEEFLRTGNKVLAYETVYPEPKKNRKVILTCAKRLLDKVEIRAEVRARVEATGVTRPAIISRLWEIANAKVPVCVNGKIVEYISNRQAAKALGLLAEICGYLQKGRGSSIGTFNQPTFNKPMNVIVRFPPPYPEEKLKEMRAQIANKKVIE